jgi:hypothetical protein
MSQVQVAGTPEIAPVCPNCQRLLTEKLVCWGCCDRLCAGCGQPTGSAFIELCWPCSFGTAGGEGAAEQSTPTVV